MKVALIVAVVVVLDLGVVGVLVWALVRGTWRPLMDRFPARPSMPEIRPSRSHQSSTSAVRRFRGSRMAESTLVRTKCLRQ